jgi:hypothetical protein
MEVSDKLQAQSSLPLGKEPLVPIQRSLHGPQGRFGPCGERKQILTPAENRTLIRRLTIPLIGHYTDWHKFVMKYVSVFLQVAMRVNRQSRFNVKNWNMRRMLTCVTYVTHALKEFQLCKVYVHEVTWAIKLRIKCFPRNTHSIPGKARRVK